MPVLDQDEARTDAPARPVDAAGGAPRRRWRPPRPGDLALATLGYLVVVVAFTRAAWLDPLHRWAGLPGDPHKFMNYLAWFPFALRHGHDPLHMTWMNVPAGTNAMWDTTMPLPALVASPVTAIFGVVATYNVLLAGSMLANAVCTYAWLRRHVRHGAAAFCGGLLAALGPYGATRAWGHLNLIMYFAIPLMLMVVEDLVREPERHPLRRGAMLGVLAAVQLLCTEELLAVIAPVILIALLAAAASAPQTVVPVARTLGRPLVAAGAAFLIVAGIPLAYQFLGPGVVRHAIQPPNVYVNDLLNFVQPTWIEALAPGASPGSVHWTGAWTEWNGYVGIPMLLVAVFTAVRWWGERWVRTLAIATLASAVLGLGPYLHVGGTSTIAMPEWILDRLPVFTNILPGRFGLPMDLGLAGLLAVFLDHALGAPRRVQVAGALAALAVGVTLWPAMTMPATHDDTPAYFTADARTLPFGTVALVFPTAGPWAEFPGLWQARADFQFRMVSGPATTVAGDGVPLFGTAVQPLRCILFDLDTPGSGGTCDVPDPAVRTLLHGLGVRYIVVGPMPNRAPIVAWADRISGTSGVPDGGVDVWRLP